MKPKDMKTTPKVRKNLEAEIRTLVIIIRWIPKAGISDRTVKLRTADRKIRSAVRFLLWNSSRSRNRRIPRNIGCELFQAMVQRAL